MGGHSETRMFGRLAALILDHVRATTLLLFSVVVGVSLGSVWLYADFNVESFFSSDDPEAAYLTAYAEAFNADDPLVVVVDGRGATLLERERLKQIDALAQAIAAEPDVARVTALTTLPTTGERLAGMYVPKPLLASVPPPDASPDRLKAWQEDLRADPRFVPTFLSEDGEWGALIVELAVDLGDLVEVRRAVSRLEQLAAEHSEADGLGYRLGGVPSVRAHIVEVLLGDQIYFVPIAGLLILVLLAYLFRSQNGVMIPAVAALVPALMLFGWMGLRGEPIGLLNQIYLILIPAIAVADAIHLLSRFHEESWRLGGESLTPVTRRAAIIETMQHMGAACFLTSFTTLIGFLSLDFTRMHVLRQFGNYAALGVAFSFLTVLFILPLTLWWSSDRARRPRHGMYDRLGRGLHALARASIRRPWHIVGVTVVLVAGALVAATRVSVDYAITATYDADHPVTIANTQVDRHLGGLLALELDLNGAPGTFADPDVLAALDEVGTSLILRDEVRQVVGLAGYLSFASAMMGGPERVPGSEDLARRVFTFAKTLGGLEGMVNADRSRSRLVLRTVDLGAAEFELLADELTAEVSAALSAHDVEVHPTGPSLLAYRGLARVSSDLRNSLIGAALLIGVVIGFLFRSPAIGLLSLVPNIIPLVIGYGLLGVLGWSLDPAPAVVFTVALGIAVDSTIHVLARFREERTSGRSVPDAIESAVEHSGRAVTVTAVILVIGIGINTFSSFPANVTFGFLGSFILVVALLSNLVVLPALLAIAYRGGAARPLADPTGASSDAAM